MLPEESFLGAKYRPNGDGNCAVMFKHYNQDYGLFNVIYKGFISDIFERVSLRALTKRVCFINYVFYCDFTEPILSLQIAFYKLFLK